MTTAVAATSASRPQPAASGTRRRMWLIGGIGGAVALIALVAAAVLVFNDDVPRLNENAVVLAKFVHAGRFHELPFEQQRQFYKVLDDRDDELDQAFADRRLTESEYRSGLEAAWLGKHLNRVEKYFALPPGQGRVNYITKLLDKKERKKPEAAGDIDADETVAEMRVEKWPPAVRSQWELFHDAYRKERKAREAARRPQTKPAP